MFSNFSYKDYNFLVSPYLHGVVSIHTKNLQIFISLNHGKEIICQGREWESVIICHNESRIMCRHKQTYLG